MQQSLKNQFDSVLDKDEKVLWHGKATFIPFVLSGLPLLGFGILWGFIDYGFIQKSLSSPNNLDITLIPFFLLHLTPLWLGIGNFIRLFLVFTNTGYVITNKRVLLRTGFWGIDFKSVDYDKIQDAQVTVNPLERIFNVGSIRINSGFTNSRGVYAYDTIAAISDPYEVFRKIKTTSVNVKTDWNYPNKLRPDENPGYKTKYNPET